MEENLEKLRQLLIERKDLFAERPCSSNQNDIIDPIIYIETSQRNRKIVNRLYHLDDEIKILKDVLIACMSCDEVKLACQAETADIVEAGPACDEVKMKIGKLACDDDDSQATKIADIAVEGGDQLAEDPAS